jgi:hypothetical protein
MIRPTAAPLPPDSKFNPEVVSLLRELGAQGVMAPEAIRRARCGGLFIEVDGVPTPCEDVEKWAEILERQRWTVRDEFDGHPIYGCAYLSTVFMGLDMTHGTGEVPLFYGSAVLARDEGRRGLLAGEFRHETREQALRFHARALAQIRAGERITEENEP